MAQSNYCFPILDVKSLIQSFNELNSDLDITEQDFQHPQRDRWQKFYTLILSEIFVGVTPDSFNQMVTFTNDIEYPELIEDALPLINLPTAMEYLCQCCGIDAFKMSDILNPKPKRLVKICSGIINFRKFTDDRLDVYADIKSENDALQDQREALLKENKEYKMKINTIKTSFAEKEPEIKMLQDLIEEQTRQVSAINGEINNEQRETNEIKTKLAEKKFNVARQKEQLTLSKQENSSLSSQIVPSPDRLKSEMQRLEVQLTQAAAAKEAANIHLAEVRQRRKLQQKRSQEFDQVIKLVNSLKEHMDKHSELQQTLSEQKEEMSTKRDEIKSLDARGHNLKLQLSMLQEKFDKVNLLHNAKMEGIRTEVHQLTELREKQSDHNSAQDKLAYRLQQERHRIREEVDAENQRHDQLMAHMMDKYRGLQEEVQKYHNRLNIASETLRDRTNTASTD